MKCRDVVVLLPGIGGSILSKNNKKLWSATTGAIIRALASGGDSIRELELDPALWDTEDDDGVHVDGPVEDLHIIPGLWKIDGYTKLRRAITESLELQPQKNYFEFPYDWRRSNRVAGRRLAQEAPKWLAAWKKSSGATDAKLVFLCHSMGGLVVRHYLECLGGWRDARAVITFGTPHAGSLAALGFLSNGYSKSVGPIKLDFTSVLRSFTSVYELLPTKDVVEAAGVYHTIADAPAIANVDIARAKAALAFHDEIEQHRLQNEKDDAYKKDKYGIYPVVGIKQPTFLSARRDGAGRITLLPTLGDKDYGGDGTVPFTSAIAPELLGSTAGMFAADAHGSLQNSSAVHVHIKGAIINETLAAKVYRDDGAIFLSLDFDDVYASGTPVELRVKPDSDVTDLRATVTDALTGHTMASVALFAGPDDWRLARIDLSEGVYRATIEGPNVSTATDCFAVTG